MMSCDPFEDLDDTLFHDFGSEEVLEEPLDMTDPFEKRKTKHFAVRIKPLVMKRRWRSMPMKRKRILMKCNMLRHHYLFSHLMKLRLSNLSLLLFMKLKKQLAS
jgi:hypothetical protein